MALIDNISAYYKFDDNAATTNVIDAHGSADGTASTNTSNLYDASGKINSAFHFNGTNENLTIPMPVSSGEVTFGAWVKLDALGTFRSVMQQQGSGLWPDFKIYIRSDNVPYADYGDGTAWHPIYANGAMSVDTWYHLMATIDGTNFKFYVNGSLQTDTDTGGDLVVSGTTLLIGSHNIPGAWIDGLIDEPCFWNRALSSIEISQLYNSGDGLAYPFSAGTNIKINIGDTFKDVSEMKINIGDSWKAVTEVKQNVGDAWKTVF